jgi:hypothetical protein
LMPRMPAATLSQFNSTFASSLPGLGSRMTPNARRRFRTASCRRPASACGRRPTRTESPASVHR